MAEWSVFVVPIFRLVRMMIEILEEADKGFFGSVFKLNFQASPSSLPPLS